MVPLTLSRTAVLLAALSMVSPPPGGSQGQESQVSPPTPGAATGDPGLGVDQRALIGEPLGTPLSGSELDRVTEELSSSMRCPVCQALSIADSPSISALAMKQEIREFLADGYTDEQIVLYFERAYGEFIRLEPKAKGFNLVVWIAPLLIFLLGGGLVAARLRKVQESSEEAEQEALDPEMDTYLEQVRREVT